MKNSSARGESNLGVLLKSMSPKLYDSEFVFCTVSLEALPSLSNPPTMFFHEQEGVTLILRKEEADKAKLEYDSTWAMITLTVHSNLNAIGFISEISNELAKNEISTNVVSGFYHDHIFVPHKYEKKALTALRKLSQQ